jgi:hypothetical protein
MLVRYKAGRHAGEVRDLRSDIALEMLRLGRVDNAFVEQRQPIAVATSQEAKPATSRKKARR